MKFYQRRGRLNSTSGDKNLKIFCDINDLTRSEYVNRKYKLFKKTYGYIPKYFDLYNTKEITNIAPTLGTRSNGAMGCGTILVVDICEEGIANE